MCLLRSSCSCSHLGCMASSLTLWSCSLASSSSVLRMRSGSAYGRDRRVGSGQQDGGSACVGQAAQDGRRPASLRWRRGVLGQQAAGPGRPRAPRPGRAPWAAHRDLLRERVGGVLLLVLPGPAPLANRAGLL
jgi:hypothetical protein